MSDSDAEIDFLDPDNAISGVDFDDDEEDDVVERPAQRTSLEEKKAEVQAKEAEAERAEIQRQLIAEEEAAQVT